MKTSIPKKTWTFAALVGILAVVCVALYFYLASSVASNNTAYLYCIGGASFYIQNNSIGVHNINATYYAPVTLFGLGKWSLLKNLDLEANSLSFCAYDSDTIYCLMPTLLNNRYTLQMVYGQLFNNNSVDWLIPNMSINAYPSNIVPSCVFNQNYAYCTAGFYTAPPYAPMDTNRSFYSNVSAEDKINWIGTSDYPIAISNVNCYTYNESIICIGGYKNFSESQGKSIGAVNNTYIAPISINGIGPWKVGPNYPDPINPSCVTYGGYIYCIGGLTTNDTFNGNDYYAQLSSNGIGNWIETDGYPIHGYAQACVAYGGYVYCVGGRNLPNSTTSNVYYAQLSSSGIGTWIAGSSYPIPAITDCVIANSSDSRL